MAKDSSDYRKKLLSFALWHGYWFDSLTVSWCYDRRFREGCALEKENPMGFDLVKAGIVVPAHVDRVVISVFVLDMSGSMGVYGETPPKAVDEYVKSLCRDKSAFYVVSVVGFNDRANILIHPTEVNLVRPLESYVANGNTLLYKTVDGVLLNLKEAWEGLSMKQKKHTRVVCGVFSDGADNESETPLYPARVQRISHWARSEGWELSAFGIGIEANQLAELLGFDKRLAVNVAASRAGVSHASQVYHIRTTGSHKP